jgi:hypothetical protein
MEEEPKPKNVTKLDQKKINQLRAEMNLKIVKTIVAFPSSAEASAAALAALIHCAYQVARNMWGVDEGVRAITMALDIEASMDKKKNK